MKIVITESQLKILLSEVKIKCPKGLTYDKDFARCTKIIELPQVNIVVFKNDDENGSIRKSYIKYSNSLNKLSQIYVENGMTLGKEYFYENLKKPLDGYSVEFFNTLTKKIKSKYQKEYDNFENVKREKFIKNEVKPMVGKPYVWGKMGPEFFDCSGLICNVFELGWKHNAQMLYDKSDLFYDINKIKVGDIVYFDYDPDNEEDVNDIDHVGIISKIDGNKIKMIHASGNSKCTLKKYKEDKLPKKCRVKEVNFSHYWRKNVAAFGRFKDWEYS